MKGPLLGGDSPTSHVYYSQRLRLHYLDWGNAGAPALLLVHGVQDHCHTWDALAPRFAARHHVVAPDLRGHGDSQWALGTSYHYVDYVYDLNQLVDQAGLAPVTLVAHSMGGTLALLFAGTYPEKVARVAVIEAIGLWGHRFAGVPAAERLRTWIDETRALAGRQPRRYASVEEAYARMQTANPNLSADQARHLTIHGANQNEDGSWSWKYDNYTYARPAFGLSDAQTIELWRRITCPVLILNADDGYDHRVGHAGTDEHFADVTMETIARAGHWTYHDQLDEVARHLDAFLASDDGATG